MKFHEKLLEIRKKRGLSQEELGMHLQVSRQTISKWETGQSYPDFQRLVLLSDYFHMTLDELVRDIDVQDVREQTLTDEKVLSMYSDLQTAKALCRKGIRYFCYFGYAICAFVIIVMIIAAIIKLTA